MSAAPAPDSLPTDLEGEIMRLKDERNAILLAHYYQEDEIQDLADVVGECRDQPVTAIWERIDAAVKRFVAGAAQFDDLTLTLVKRS